MANKSRFSEAKYNGAPAKRIRELLQTHEMTHTQLAEKIDVSESAVSQFQAGKSAPKLDTLVKIAKVFNTTTDYLLEITDDPNIQYSVIDDTGLSSDSINTLKKLKGMHAKGYYQLSLINSILSYPELDDLLSDVETYFSSVHAKEIFKHYHDSIVTVADKIDDELSFMDLCFYLEHRVSLENYTNKEDLENNELSNQYIEQTKQYYQTMFAILNSRHYNPLITHCMLELFNSPNPHESKLDCINALKVLESLKSLKDHILQGHMRTINSTLISLEELVETDTILIDW